jgi:hypothetical protein
MKPGCAPILAASRDDLVRKIWDAEEMYQRARDLVSEVVDRPRAGR